MGRPGRARCGLALLARAAAWAAGASFGLLRAIGPVAASNLGGTVARAVGPWLRTSRIADANLRRALPALDAADRARLIGDVWDNLGRTVAELPHVAGLRRTATGPGWEVEGAAYLDDLRRTGGPVLFFSGHIGNWEVLPRVAAELGMPVAGVYRPPANRHLDALILRMRQSASGGMPMFAKGARGARRALAHVTAGGSLAFLMDQKMNDGLPARFFGRPAMTAGALASIALHRRCHVIGAHVVRLGPARFRVIVEPPLVLPAGERAASVLSLTQTLNDSIERWVRERPGSWLWLHRRWVEPQPGEPGR